MLNIKAIETVYNGYRFRSRLEARWAVFFDALAIKYEYEPEGFTFNGFAYLPDFYLPTFSGGMYCEVKPDGSDFLKAREFVRASHFTMWLCEGTPDYKVYEVVSWEPTDYDEDGNPLECGIDGYYGVPNGFSAEGENRMFWEPGCYGDDGKIYEEYTSWLGETFLNAVLKARQARFEHGENGRTKNLYH